MHGGPPRLEAAINTAGWRDESRRQSHSTNKRVILAAAVTKQSDIPPSGIRTDMKNIQKSRLQEMSLKVTENMLVHYYVANLKLSKWLCIFVCFRFRPTGFSCIFTAPVGILGWFHILSCRSWNNAVSSHFIIRVLGRNRFRKSLKPFFSNLAVVTSRTVVTRSRCSRLLINGCSFLLNKERLFISARPCQYDRELHEICIVTCRPILTYYKIIL